MRVEHTSIIILFYHCVDKNTESTPGKILSRWNQQIKGKKRKKANHLFIGNGDWKYWNWLNLVNEWSGMCGVWTMDELSVWVNVECWKLYTRMKMWNKIEIFRSGKKEEQINTDERTIAALTAVAASFNLLYFLEFSISLLSTLYGVSYRQMPLRSAM